MFLNFLPINEGMSKFVFLALKQDFYLFNPMMTIKFKTLSVIGLLVLTFSQTISQETISLADYQKKYPNDQAVVLNHTQKITLSVNSSTGELEIFETDYEEILYLTNSSRFYTSQSVSLSDFFEDLVSINAMVIKADGKKKKLKEEDFKLVDSEPSSWVFHDDDKELVFDLIELREGYRSQISYTKKLKRPEFFDIFHFFSYYPVKYNKLELVYSPEINIDFHEWAFHKYKPTKSESTDKKGNKVMSWEISDLPPYRTEKGSTPLNNHIPHVIARIVSYKANGKEVKLLGSVEELHTFFEGFLAKEETETKKKEVQEVTNSIIEGKTTDLEKMDTIYKWVQDNIKYIAFEDGINGYIPRSCSVVMKNRFGDCKDMSTLLVEMLHYAGIAKAYYAWVGTDDIPYQMSEVPSPLTCNHVICVVEKEDGSYYFLDATGSEMGYVVPPQAIQEKELLIHKGPGEFKLYKVPAVPAEENYFKATIEYTYAEGDSIRGKGHDHLGGYEREKRTYEMKNSDPEDLYDYIKDVTLGGRNRFTLLNYEILNLENNNKELELKYDFSVDNLVMIHNGDYIINPFLFKPRQSKYNNKDHQYARSRDHHRLVDYTYILHLPEGYVVKHLPQNTSYTHDLFSCGTSYKQEGNKITANVFYKYHLLSIPPDLFEEWNKFADYLNQSTAQNIVFTKK